MLRTAITTKWRKFYIEIIKKSCEMTVSVGSRRFYWSCISLAKISHETYEVSHETWSRLQSKVRKDKFSKWFQNIISSQIWIHVHIHVQIHFENFTNLFFHMHFLILIYSRFVVTSLSNGIFNICIFICKFISYWCSIYYKSLHLYSYPYWHSLYTCIDIYLDIFALWDLYLIRVYL